MSQERLSMCKISEVLRLSQESKLSNGKIAGSLGISKSTVAAYLTLAKNAGVVLAAVKNNGLALKFTHPTLLRDQKIILAALRQNPGAVIYVPEKLKL